MPDFISPVYNRSPKRTLSTKMWMLIGGLTFALVAAGLMMMLTRANDPTIDMDRLNARVAQLQEIIKLGQKHARKPEVVKITTDANIFLVGDVPALTAATKAAGAKGSHKSVIAAEADEEALGELTTAAVNGMFDDADVRQLQLQLQQTQVLIKKIHSRTSRTQFKQTLETAYTHCGNIVAEIEKL